MVFIVKIPNRSRANTPEASNTPTNQTVSSPPQALQTAAIDIVQTTTPPSRTEAVASMDYVAAPPTGVLPGTSSTRAVRTAASTTSAQSAAELDILLAPSVLKHRYVRGVDKSLIVERPERIRAVLLGIATAIGKSSSEQPHDPTMALHTSQRSPSKAPSQQQNTIHLASSIDSSVARTTTHVSCAPLPANTPSQQDQDDDLVARLSSLSVQATAAQHPTSPAQQKFRVLHSTRSLPLDPPHPAVAFTHAHSDEVVSLLETAYGQARQKHREARTATSTCTQASDALIDASQFKPERETTPTPASVAAGPPSQQQAASSLSPARTSHAAYLEYLCNKAPSHPPQSHRKPHQTSPSKSIPEDSETYTSSDGEGDDAMHLSEVPEHLPQGDLYLAGPSDQSGMDGGSAEAIRHAMGACCEAVDRVVSAAASTTMASPTLSPLREIKVQDSTHLNVTESLASNDDNETAPAAKRAFVLSRPPGHHCSGSTPQGFCWVNNAIVAAAHAYHEHSIDRVVIFDIDLHHGNGTQNLAWRINADANKHDDQRTERIASLRVAALERARQALGSGSGRAHASRLAKVALTEHDEAEVKRQAGPRALRLFYSSLHDIESFPCEDGDPGMIKDASTCVEGAHGQWIWNIHLDHYRTESDFRRLYDDKYKIVFSKAARFLGATCATQQNTLVLISAGFDACAYEYPGMQRHGKHVPPSFYHMFARDAVHFADAHADGKLVSVLEGGYSDRALCSAALAHVTGLAVRVDSAASSVVGGEAETEYWKLENLIAVEKVAKKMAAHAAAAVSGAAPSTNTTPKRRQAELAPWLSLTSKAFAAFEQACGKGNVVPLGIGATPSTRSSATTNTTNSPAIGAGGRVLRDRGALRTRPGAWESATSTPHARRAASPTKTAGRKDSPIKKESPSSVTSVGGVVDASATPVMADTQRGLVDDSMSMDTDTPTKSVTSDARVRSLRLPSPLKSIHQSNDNRVRKSDVEADQQRQANSTDPTIAPTQVDPSVPAAPVDTNTSTFPSALSTYGNAVSTDAEVAASPSIEDTINASTTLRSRTLSSAHASLVDTSFLAHAPMHVDAADTHASSDSLGQLYDNGDSWIHQHSLLGGEPDAPGSPDWSAAHACVPSTYQGEPETQAPATLGTAVTSSEFTGAAGVENQASRQHQAPVSSSSSLYPDLASCHLAHPTQ